MCVRSKTTLLGATHAGLKLDALEFKISVLWPKFIILFASRKEAKLTVINTI